MLDIIQDRGNRAHRNKDNDFGGQYRVRKALSTNVILLSTNGIDWVMDCCTDKISPLTGESQGRHFIMQRYAAFER
jgi:hypothetical protein